ncbi:MAG: isopentenyl phosphate kinase [Prochloraceae cyanobacterium]|nr:isopentenyl phosphate kinase [Prochloraceae cyanobacterium]
MTTDFPPVFILKIGGSLITDKDAYCTPNIRAIQDFIRVIKLNLTELQNRLILIIGSGSFGHGTVLKFNLHSSSGDWKNSNLAIPTIKLFEFMTLIAMMFREQDVPCYPFQTSSYLTTSEGQPVAFFIEPIIQVLSMGIIPILSGDIVFDRHKQFVVFSSDRIPELFLNRLIIKRVAILTNVPGLLCSRKNSVAMLRFITKDNYKFALQAAETSNQPDVSGGMATKIDALIRLAKRGVESVVCDGRDPHLLIPALYEPNPNGTIIQPW